MQQKISHHAAPVLGTLTIGQAPRIDIASVLDAALPTDTNCIHAGVLDSLSTEQIQQQYSARPGRPMLITCLLDGSTVKLDKASVEQSLIAKITELERQGCTIILLLCTGEFQQLPNTGSWIVAPDRIIPPAVAALLGARQAGIVVPLSEQAETENTKFSILEKPPLYAAASPYSDALESIDQAVASLHERGAEAIVLDCMGFTETHRRAARGVRGLPVILSNSLAAKIVTEMVR